MQLTSLLCSALLGLGAAAGPDEAPPKAAAPAEKPAQKGAKQAGAKKKSTAKRADALAGRVQRFYDRLEDYEADFVQTYTRHALSRSVERSGVITIKKGGKIHWSYLRPNKTLYVADGETLWIYEPEERQVVVDRSFSTEQLGDSIAFLWGDGSLTESFDITTGDAEAHGFEKGAAVLELVPKKDQTYRKLVLRVDPKTGRVEESVIYETSDNTNRFRFSKPKLNQDIPDEKFEFVPPAGVDVVPLRGS